MVRRAFNVVPASFLVRFSDCLSLFAPACATFSSTSIIFAKTTLGMKSSQVTIVACIAQATGVLGGFASPTLQRRLGWSNLLSMCALVGILASICLYGVRQKCSLPKNIEPG